MLSQHNEIGLISHNETQPSPSSNSLTVGLKTPSSTDNLDQSRESSPEMAQEILANHRDIESHDRQLGVH